MPGISGQSSFSGPQISNVLQLDVITGFVLISLFFFSIGVINRIIINAIISDLKIISKSFNRSKLS